MPLYLIGMPAVGKSTLAHALARHLQRPVADVDTLAETLMGMSIAQAIEEKGVPFFQQAEADALQKLSTQQGLVVATGGNTPCMHNGMEMMLATGLCVWLQVPLSVLAERIWAVPLTRTHLTRSSLPDLEEQLAWILKRREPTYAQAQVHLAHPFTLDEVADAVAAYPHPW
jgi:shikimate kinase